MRVVNVVATCTGLAEELLRRYPHAETRAGAAVYGDGWTALVYRTGRVKLFAQRPVDIGLDCRVDLIVAVASVRRLPEEEAAERLRAAGFAVDRSERSTALLAYGPSFTLRLFATGKAVIFARSFDALAEAAELIRRLT